MKTPARKSNKRPIPTSAECTELPVRQHWIKFLAITVALLTFAIYLPALNNGLLVNWDEDVYILNNVHIRSLNIDFFRWAILDYKTNLWHPVTWLSHAIDYALWGLNPFGHHLTSILLHAVNSGIVVMIAYRLIRMAPAETPETVTTSLTSTKNALIASIVTGLLFGIHPIHVESVAWATERKDLLYSLFYLLSIIFYLRHVTDCPAGHPPRKFIINRQYQVSLLLFLLSIASKPMAVTLPVVLLLLDWYPLQRLKNCKNLLYLAQEKLPYFLLSGSIALITVIAQKHHSVGGLISLEKAPLLFRFLLAMKSLMLYCANILFPHNLLPIYFYPRDRSILKPEFGYAALFILLTAAACFLLRKRRVIPASLMFFVISLFPVLGLMQAGVQSMADRFAYLATIGPFLLTGLGISWIWSRTGTLAHRRIPVRTAVAAATLAVTLLLSYVTYQQIGIWKNAIILWSHTITKSTVPDKELYIFRADALEKSGELEKAQDDYANALTIDPNYPGIYFNRGINFLHHGYYDRAIEDFTTVTKLTPEDIDTYINRGNAYLKKGDSQHAISDYTHAIERKTRNADIAYVNRSNAYANIGEINKAIQDISTAITLNKEFLSLYVVRGTLNMQTGNFAQAMEDFKAACEKGLQDGCRKAAFPF